MFKKFFKWLFDKDALLIDKKVIVKYQNDINNQLKEKDKKIKELERALNKKVLDEELGPDSRIFNLTKENARLKKEIKSKEASTLLLWEELNKILHEIDEDKELKERAFRSLECSVYNNIQEVKKLVLNNEENTIKISEASKEDEITKEAKEDKVSFDHTINTLSELKERILDLKI